MLTRFVLCLMVSFVLTGAEPPAAEQRARVKYGRYSPAYEKQLAAAQHQAAKCCGHHHDCCHSAH